MTYLLCYYLENKIPIRLNLFIPDKSHEKKRIRLDGIKIFKGKSVAT